MPVEQDVLLREPGQIIELFSLDLSPITQDVVPPTDFHSGLVNPAVSLIFQGVTYDPLPIEATGFQVSARGKLPRPKMRIANIQGFISTLLTNYDDLIGAKLTRKRERTVRLWSLNLLPVWMSTEYCCLGGKSLRTPVHGSMKGQSVGIPTVEMAPQVQTQNLVGCLLTLTYSLIP